MAYFYIINPLAGGKKYQRIAEKFRQKLGELGIAGEFAIATAQDDLSQLAKIGVERKFSTIVAVGGNDTVNAVAKPLIGEEKIAFGIVPFGYSNTFANLIGISDWKKALEILASRRIENIDVGFLGPSVFLTQVFVTPKKSPIPAKICYIPFSKQKPLSREAVTAEIEINGKYTLTGRILSLTIANAEAGSRCIRPSLTNGRFKIRLFSKKEGFSLFQKPDITKLQAEKVSISSSIPLYFSIDGKLVAQTPSSIAIYPKGLRLIVGKENFERKNKLEIEH